MTLTVSAYFVFKKYIGQPVNIQDDFRGYKCQNCFPCHLSQINSFTHNICFQLIC